MKNTPYKKQLDKNGILLNPITKEKPYLNSANVYLFNLLKRKQSIKLRYWEHVKNKYFMGKNVTV